MGADVIFWPESLDGLLETLDVNWNNKIESYFSRKHYKLTQSA